MHGTMRILTDEAVFHINDEPTFAKERGECSQQEHDGQIQPAEL